MDFTYAKNKLASLSGRFNMLLVLCVGLLATNAILALCLFWLGIHTSRIIVPPVVDAPFKITDSSVDASYLQQMSLFFINERLNITPQTIEQNHALLLQYSAPAFYHDFAAVLEAETQAVTSQKISSVFYVEATKAFPKQLAVHINGELRRWVGERQLPPVKKQYIMRFTYSMGDLKIKSLEELPNDKTDSSNPISSIQANIDLSRTHP